jgi:hypothetical protein
MKVTRVLLPDGWYEAEGFEVHRPASAALRQLCGGDGEGLAPMAFTFLTPNGLRIAGPTSSVVAVEGDD